MACVTSSQEALVKSAGKKGNEQGAVHKRRQHFGGGKGQNYLKICRRIEVKKSAKVGKGG